MSIEAVPPERQGFAEEDLSDAELQEAQFEVANKMFFLLANECASLRFSMGWLALEVFPSRLICRVLAMMTSSRSSTADAVWKNACGEREEREQGACGMQAYVDIQVKV